MSNELLLKKGIKYDHSLMHNDFTPYWVRVGDTWTKIDYSKKAEEWMKPLVRGEETDLIEIPASWYLDDLPPMMFMKAAPNSHGFVNPRHLEEMWRDQFDWVYREMDYAVFPITIHPDVSGKPQVLLMLERLSTTWSAIRVSVHHARRDRGRFRQALPARQPRPPGVLARAGPSGGHGPHGALARALSNRGRATNHL